MKTTITALLAFVLLAVGGCIGFYFGATHAKRSTLAVATPGTPATSIAPSGTGKFQIVPGEYIFTSGDRGTTQHGMFRINTETGETELFREYIDSSGKLKPFWDRIE